MAFVFKRTRLQPLPAGAVVSTHNGMQVATWMNRGGKKLRADVVETGNGDLRRRTEGKEYYARYRLADGRKTTRNTKCTTDVAARQVLAEWTKKEEQIKAGVYTKKQLQTAEQMHTDIGQHVDDYLAHLEAAGVSDEHFANVRRHLWAGIKKCGFASLADIDASKFTDWLKGRVEVNSARTRNMYRASWIAFCNWCCDPDQRRMNENPLNSVPVADERVDRRRERRALGVDDLMRFLEAARTRPLLDALTIRRGKNKGKPLAKVKPETRRQLERLGRERELIYRTLIFTGLRQNELASLTLGQARLDAEVPHVVLKAGQ